MVVELPSTIGETTHMPILRTYFLLRAQAHSPGNFGAHKSLVIRATLKGFNTLPHSQPLQGCVLSTSF